MQQVVGCPVVKGVPPQETAWLAFLFSLSLSTLTFFYLQVYLRGREIRTGHQSRFGQPLEHIYGQQRPPPLTCTMNKLLGQRKKFNLDLSSTDFSSSEDERKTTTTTAPALNRFNISLTIRDDGCLLINSAPTSDRYDGDDTEDCNLEELPKVVRKQRTNSQRSNKSTRTPATNRTPASEYVDETSDDEAFMADSRNFQSSPKPLRRSLRKKKTSSLKRRTGVQTVPEVEDIRRVTCLDTTLEGDAADLSIEWIQSEYYSTDAQSSESGCHVMSEKSLIIANAETEDDVLSDNHPGGAVFKMPFPVNYRPNLSKRKLAVESDEEYISKTFRGPVKRACIRYFY